MTSSEQLSPTRSEEQLHQTLWPQEKEHIPGARVAWPAWEIPAYRTSIALQQGCADNLLFILWGGIGDQLCSEPTLRFALDQFKGCKVSLATDFPEMFSHLKFHEVFNTKQTRPDASKYLVFKTITVPTDLSWQFMSHCITHCVDFPSLCALRCQLPIAYKAVQIEPEAPADGRLISIATNKKNVLVHAGKHWESKTFPVEYWNSVLQEMVDQGLTPVLIGKTVDTNVGYVDCYHEKAIDLRDQCSLKETLWLCKHSSAMICSDSAPLHMATTGHAHIAFICSAKHQDYIYHWRMGYEDQPEWAWRMKHFNKGGMWDIMDMCPNQSKEQVVDKCDPEILKTWLPEPKEIVSWISQQLS